MYNPDTIKEDLALTTKWFKQLLGYAVLILVFIVTLFFTAEGIKATYLIVTKEKAKVYKTPTTKIKAVSITLYEESKIRCVNYSDNTKQCKDY